MGMSISEYKPFITGAIAGLMLAIAGLAVILSTGTSEYKFLGGYMMFGGIGLIIVAGIYVFHDIPKLKRNLE
jgi:hypothetical protein